MVPALRIVSMVPVSVHRTDRVTEVRALLDAAAPGTLDPIHEGHAWAAIGNMSFELGDWPASAAANRRAVGCFETAGHDRLAGWSRYLLAHSHWGAGELDELDRIVETTVDRFRSAGDDNPDLRRLRQPRLRGPRPRGCRRGADLGR